MQTKIIEATNGPLNWGKFLLGRLDVEWNIASSVDTASPFPLLRTIGWSRDQSHIWILDLQTREGAMFRVDRHAVPSSDLNKHKIWVCPLFEPFLEWLYKQDVTDLDALPAHIDLAFAPFAFRGYRRPGG